MHKEDIKALAKDIITGLHGEAEYEKAVKISEALFSGNIKYFRFQKSLLFCFKRGIKWKKKL